MNNDGPPCLPGSIIISLPYNKGHCYPDSLRVVVDGDSVAATITASMAAICEHNDSAVGKRSRL